MSKAQIVLQIIALLQGTPIEDFARDNLYAVGDKVIVRCAETTSVERPEGQFCKRAMATALRRYSYRFTATQLAVLADLYATALEHLEPAAVPRVRRHMCDATSEAALSDAAAASAVCERLSTDY
jgi:hypothetical protein